MTYKEILDSISLGIEKIILEEVDDATEIHTPDFGWKNKRYISDSFRVAHIERYSERTLEVLHFTCFPNVTCPHPIFGFDVISTDKKPLAAFLDWSPVADDVKLNLSFTFKDIDYPLPDWAKSIFSDRALAIVPRGTFDMEILRGVVFDSLKDYLNLLTKYSNKLDNASLAIIAEKQNFYCEQQLKNERTYNVLKAKLGADGAKNFMETILFPKIILH